MDAVVAWDGDHRAELPVALDHVGAVFLGPDQRVTAGAAEQYQMRARAMAVGLLVRANRKLGDVTLGVVVGHLQHRVDTAGAPLLPSIEQHVRRVGDKVGLPYPPVVELAITVEVIFFTRITAAKPEIAIENKFAVPEQAHHRRRVGHCNITGGLIAAAVEVLVPRIKRNREETPGLPFKTFLLLLILPDRRCATARNHIDRELVHVMLRLGLASWLDLDDVTVVGHVAIGDVDDGATATLTLPRPQLDFRQTREVELLMYFH